MTTLLTNRIVYTPQIKCYLVTYQDKEFIGDRRILIRDWKQAIGDELTKSKTGRQAFARIVFNWIQDFWPLIFIYLWLTRPVDSGCNDKPVCLVKFMAIKNWTSLLNWLIRVHLNCFFFFFFYKSK